MRPNPELKLHFINVNHGDATIIEFPDYGGLARFGVVDFGAKTAIERAYTRDYMLALIDLRADADPAFDYVIEFACVTHPHDDHYGGLSRFMDQFADSNNVADNKIAAFWDCGFRTNATNYNSQLQNILQNDNLTFIRVTAGAEFEFGQVRITVLAPSIDLRNRYDTLGIGKNDASIVLKIKFNNSYVVLSGDAEFASWGKSTEEFPRISNINFFQDALALAERDETADQLRCNLLKLAHHGSKHGTSLEYLERVLGDQNLNNRHVVIPAGSQAWYTANKPNWVNMFPHPLVSSTLNTLGVPQNQIYISGDEGNMIFKYDGNYSPRAIASFLETPGSPQFGAELAANWA